MTGNLVQSATAVASRDIDDVRRHLSTPKRVVITTHLRPDGDAMGSALAVYHHLKQLGHDLQVIVPTEVPDYLAWMPGAGNSMVAENHPAEAAQMVAQAEIIFALDFGVLSRSGVLEPALRSATAYKLHLDHHLDLEPFADFDLRDEKASSTCELVFRFLSAFDPTGKFSTATATCLYTGIMTDTGSFRFDTTSPAVHRIAATLIEAGAEVGKIHHKVYDGYSEARTRFLGYCLSEKLRMIPEAHSAYITVSKAEQERFKITSGDTEGIVNYALGIRGINLGAILIEYPDQVKLSFRSVGKFSANAFAANFAGGGHFNAAGGSSKLTLHETEAKFVALVLANADALAYEAD